ncbi:MAG: hypothetical protein D3915_03815 [Candidatus Electrothrix sp. AU1_5]|nr:hypothetical protein [Candidatus Electrothrix gigas]
MPCCFVAFFFVVMLLPLSMQYFVIEFLAIAVCFSRFSGHREQINIAEMGKICYVPEYIFRMVLKRMKKRLCWQIPCGIFSE